MANKMLIDAAHPEETRVVVLRGNRVEDFDFESASKKPLRGNIYLAKVTRVEPSLQAAFIEYGGNRHGFLAFSEIHPDYYQIPVADRQALLEEEARAHREEEDEQRQSTPRRSRRRRHNGGRPRNADEGAQGADPGSDDEFAATTAVGDQEDTASDVEIEAVLTPEAALEVASASDAAVEAEFDATLPEPVAEGGFAADPREAEPTNPDDAARSPAMPAGAYDAPSDRLVGDVLVEENAIQEESATPPIEARGADLLPDADGSADDGRGDERATSEASDLQDDGEVQEEPVEQIGGDALEDVPYRAPRLRRHYKIQEVIKRRQILLVQVVKEERGNKGAALTTYLSLAGRYSVLMPNTARGGGISRKITDAEDRKRLKAIAGELDVPDGMGIILRTAGAARGEGEVKRDFEYLLRMWETVRELTLRSSAPMLVYEEGSLIKRAIRDLYSKEIDEILVAGEDAYREAKDFMRLLMPNQVRNVVPYRDQQPIFAKSGAEAQLDAMFSNHVTLKSGGYLVINQTEALVAIDVNSGRSTREHNIEDTALRTNLEAADEVARQLRLRDLAGLIVVDFIDMEEGRNNRSVERRMKDALKNDRARIQIGRISHFGLLEMSRQRIRPGVLEGSTVLCPHCMGAGTVRSTSSIALHVLRVLEDHLIRSSAFNLIVRTRIEVALYVLNQKRQHLADIEGRFGVNVTVMADPSLTGTVYHAVERGEPATPVAAPRTQALGYGDGAEATEVEPELEEIEDVGPEDASEDLSAEGESGLESDGNGERRRRRRRRRRGRDRGPSSIEADAEQPSDVGMEVMARAEGDFPESGFRPELDDVGDDGGTVIEPTTPDEHKDTIAAPGESGEVAAEIEPEVREEAEVTPRRRRSRRAAPRAALADDGEAGEGAAAKATPVITARRSRRSRSRAASEEVQSLAPADMPVEIPATDAYRLDAPSADRDVGADTAKNHASDPEPTEAAASSLTGEPASIDAPASRGESEAAPTSPIEAVDEPPRPKRSGWWQRAKATITGE